MDWLNYNHLYYFWTVAREGSIARAASKLRRSQPTLSAQLRVLERQLGDKLFTRAGRGIQTTDFGREIFRYTDDIFTIGENLARMVQGRPQMQQVQFVAGVLDAIPKPVVFEILKFTRTSARPLRVVCREDRHERLLHSLALNELDVVVTDRPAESSGRHRLQSHLLGRSPVAFFGSARYRGLRRRFPQSLKGVPLLLPTPVSAYRDMLDQWLEKRRIQPDIVGEFEDFELAASFARQGLGVLAGPAILARLPTWAPGLLELGRAEEATEKFYAVFNDRSSNYAAAKSMRDHTPRTLHASL